MNIGDKVRFGRPNGQQRTGVIVKINSKTYKIQTSEGKDWRVSHCLVYPTSNSTTTTTTTSSSTPELIYSLPPAFKKGQKVQFYNGLHGTQEGFVKRVNAKTVSIEPTLGSESYWRVPFSLIYS